MVPRLPDLTSFPALARQMTVALPCLGLDGMGNGLEIRWDGSHLSLAYDTDTQSIPALLSAHGKDVAANFFLAQWWVFGIVLGTLLSNTAMMRLTGHTCTVPAMTSILRQAHLVVPRPLSLMVPSE